MIPPSTCFIAKLTAWVGYEELIQHPRAILWMHLVENLSCLLQGQTFEAPVNAGGATEEEMQGKAEGSSYCQVFATLIQLHQQLKETKIKTNGQKKEKKTRGAPTEKYLSL